MQRILKSFLKQNHPRDLDINKVPLKPWKKNVFATIVGLTLGIYVGQYFPDIYFEQLQNYIPEI